MNNINKNINNSIKLKNDVIIKGENILNDNMQDTYIFIKNKTSYLSDVIRNTIFSIQYNKKNNLFSNSDLNNCILTLTELYKNIDEIDKRIEKCENCDLLIDNLQDIMEKLSLIICSFGTYNFIDLLNISYGSYYKDNKISNFILRDKIELIYKYIHPTGYKVIPWKKNINYSSLLSHNVLCSDKITDEINVIENSNQFECFDSDILNSKSFFQKINGIRIVIQNEKKQKTFIIHGIIDDIVLECFSNKYIDYRKYEIFEYISKKYSVNEYLLNRII